MVQIGTTYDIIDFVDHHGMNEWTSHLYFSHLNHCRNSSMSTKSHRFPRHEFRAAYGCTRCPHILSDPLIQFDTNAHCKHSLYRYHFCRPLISHRVSIKPFSIPVVLSSSLFLRLTLIYVMQKFGFYSARS